MPWVDSDSYDAYRREVYRLKNVAKELAKLVKQDQRLFSKISPRTKRWITTLDSLDKELEKIKDKEIRLARRRKVALSKLSAKEKLLLNLPIDSETDD